MTTSIAEVIQLTEERFNQIAPAHLKYASEKGFAIQLLKNNSYLMKVAEEAPESLQQAITNVAAIGLSLNPAEKLAYLIPRSIQIAQGKWQSRIFLEPSYMGLTRLATDSGSIKWAQAICVFANDQFVDNGPGEKPTHTYKAFAKEDIRGEFVGVYSVAKTQDNDYLTTLMTAEEVYSVRARSEAYKKFIEDKKGNGGPWITDFMEQAKKSVIRRAFKTWPRTDERRMAMLAQAIELSNQNEGFEPILTSPDIRDYTGDQKSYYDQLISNGDKLGLYAFLETVGESVEINLYHSFEKGQKGKYQRLVDELRKGGCAIMDDIIYAIEECAKNSDELGAKQNLEGLSQEVINLIKRNLSDDALSLLAD